MPTLTLPSPRFQGPGLFSGKPGEVRIFPMLSGGIIIESREPALPHQLFGVCLASSHATLANLTTDTTWSGLPSAVPIRNTTLALRDRPSTTPGTTHVAATVEHLLAALAGLNIWNAWIALSGPEIPILDGSALPFVEALRPSLAAAPGSREPLVLTTTITVEHKGASITASPPPTGAPLSYTYELDYGTDSPLPAQRATWTGNATDFATSIAPARTFSLEHEARAAQQAGLFKHLTPSDMLVIGNNGNPINNQWRMDHEPAKHKLLDLIGDLALLGRPLHATIKAKRSGHALTHELMRQILATT
jgi:UDP-3-O-acyl-N-acetylglucosamine deacetylase